MQQLGLWKVRLRGYDSYTIIISIYFNKNDAGLLEIRQTACSENMMKTSHQKFYLFVNKLKKGSRDLTHQNGGTKKVDYIIVFTILYPKKDPS